MNTYNGKSKVVKKSSMLGALAGLMLLGSSQSMAAIEKTYINDHSYYLGVDVGDNRFEDLKADEYLRIYAGIPLFRYLAIEVGYSNYGESDLTHVSENRAARSRARVKTDAYDLSLFAVIPTAWGFSFTSRYGVQFYDMEMSVDAQRYGRPVGSARDSNSRSNNVFGLGLLVILDSGWAIHALQEYQLIESDLFDEENDERVATFSIGLQKHFR